MVIIILWVSELIQMMVKVGNIYDDADQKRWAKILSRG